MLRRLCVWCPVPHPLPALPGDALLPDDTSHGMCWQAFGRELDRLANDPDYPGEEDPCDGVRGQLSLL